MSLYQSAANDRILTNSQATFNYRNKPKEVDIETEVKERQGIQDKASLLVESEING